MKLKTPTLIALAVAIVGLGLWWLSQPTTAAPEKMAAAPLPAKTMVPAKMVASPTIAPPVAPPAQQTDIALAAVAPPIEESPPDPNADPQADLKTAIPDIVRLIRAGDQVGAYKTYCPPDELNPKDVQQMQDLIMQSMAATAQVPELQQLMQKNRDEFARAFEALEDQTPIYNDAGDEATYKFAMPGEGTEPMTFGKIDGKWYIKQIARKSGT